MIWNEELELRIEDDIKSIVQRNDLDLSDSNTAHLAMQAIIKGSRAAGLGAALPERASAAIPQTWKEAEDQVPGLKRFADAKAADPKLTIIDHLRDDGRGYGNWTLREPGLPRKVLLKIDEPAYRELYAWLTKRDPNTKKRNEIPSDLYLPTRHEVLAAEAVDPDKVREANRIVRQWQRREAARKDVQER